MLFKILRIRKLIKEGTKNPSKLAKEETQSALSAFLLLPGIGIICWLALMFILGFTKLLGGPWGFFKFVFIVSTIGAIVLGTILYKLLRLAGKIAQRATEKTLHQPTRDTTYTVTDKEA